MVKVNLTSVCHCLMVNLLVVTVDGALQRATVIIFSDSERVMSDVQDLFRAAFFDCFSSNSTAS